LKKRKLKKINKDTLEEIKNAAEFATNSPFPKDSELYTDVYL
jgi:TPP-dependent pyruvate/acetoin dehydrogenase alpha subunit